MLSPPALLPPPTLTWNVYMKYVEDQTSCLWDHWCEWALQLPSFRPSSWKKHAFHNCLLECPCCFSKGVRKAFLPLKLPKNSLQPVVRPVTLERADVSTRRVVPALPFNGVGAAGKAGRGELGTEIRILPISPVMEVEGSYSFCIDDKCCVEHCSLFNRRGGLIFTPNKALVLRMMFIVFRSDVKAPLKILLWFGKTEGWPSIRKCCKDQSVNLSKQKT